MDLSGAGLVGGWHSAFVDVARKTAKDTRMLYVAYLIGVVWYTSWWSQGANVGAHIWERFQQGSLYGTIIFGLLATIVGAVRVGTHLDKADVRGIFIGIALLFAVSFWHDEMNVYSHILVLITISFYTAFHDRDKLLKAIRSRNRSSIYTRKVLLYGVDIPFCVSVAFLPIFVGTQLAWGVDEQDVHIFISGALALELTLSNGVVAFVSEKARSRAGH